MYSLNFLKLPMVRPGETRSEVSTERIAALERMVMNLVEQNKVIVDNLDQLKKKEENPLTFANRVANTGAVSKLGNAASFGHLQSDRP